jgi:lipopolysaccharide export system protein LptA
MKPAGHLLFIALAFSLDAAVAHAQSVTINPKDSETSKSPTIITADGGMEWQKNNQIIIAQKNAKAVRDDQTVTADVLIAHYRKKAPKADDDATPAVTPSVVSATTSTAAPAAAPAATPSSSDEDTGDNEIYRVDAQGHVVMTSKTETATGDAGVYDLDKNLLVLDGKTVTLVSHDGVVTAHHDIQYWSDQDVAVANGDALAVDTNPNVKRTLKADRLVAYFRNADGTSASAPNAATKTADSGTKKKKGPDTQTQRDISYMQGFGNVVLVSNEEIVHGDRSNYNLDTGIATVEGNVKMTRENTQLNGGFAVVNVKGGLSRLFASAAQAKMESPQEPARVKGLLMPKDSDSPTGGAGKGR